MDDSIFDAVAAGGSGLCVQIDYIKVLQNPDNPAHVRCSFGHERSDMTLGVVSAIHVNRHQ